MLKTEEELRTENEAYRMVVEANNMTELARNYTTMLREVNEAKKTIWKMDQDAHKLKNELDRVKDKLREQPQSEFMEEIAFLKQQLKYFARLSEAQGASLQSLGFDYMRVQTNRHGTMEDIK